MSAPATKFFPAPVRIKALISASAKHSVNRLGQIPAQLRRHLVYRWVVDGERRHAVLNSYSYGLILCLHGS